MFSAVRSTAPSTGHDQALAAWRDAASLAAARWQRFLEADRPHRTAAFAAYVMALDAEEAAADEIAGLPLAA